VSRDLPPVIVLAGGLGTRLRAITRDRWPKPMVRVAWRGRSYPFLEFVLAELRARGIRQFVICIGHLGEQISGHFGDGSAFGLSIRYSDAGDAGTGQRVLRAQSAFPAADYLVVCGDVFLSLDAPAFLRQFAAHSEWRAQIAVVPCRPDMTPNVMADPDGRVRAHGPLTGSEGRIGVEAGTLAVRRSAFEGLADGAGLSLTADVFPQLIREGRLGSQFLETDFYDIGTPEGFHAFCAFAEAGGAQPLSSGSG